MTLRNARSALDVLEGDAELDAPVTVAARPPTKSRAHPAIRPAAGGAASEVPRLPPPVVAPTSGLRRASGSLRRSDLARGDLTVKQRRAVKGDVRVIAALPVATQDAVRAPLAQVVGEATTLDAVAPIVAAAFLEVGEFAVIVDRNFRVEACTQQYLKMLGLRAEDVLGRRCHDYIKNFEATPFFAAVSSSLKSGESALQIAYSNVLGQHVSIRLHPRPDGGFLVTGSPASARMLSGHEELTRGLVDPLTNLGNRHALIRDLSETMGTPSDLCLGLFEWHNYQAVCDRISPEAAEMLLLSIVSRINHTLNRGERLYRLDTALYGVALKAETSSDAQCRRIEEILHFFTDPSSQTGRQRMNVTAFASYADHLSTAGEARSGAQSINAPFATDAAHALLRRARLTLREARARGTSGAVVAYTQAFQQRLELENDLVGAIAANQFTLFAQPKVDLFRNRICGAELLVRWNHPTRGILAPGAFLESLADLRMMVELDNWVIETAAALLGDLVRSGRPVPLAINLSVETLGDPAFVERIKSVLERHGVPPALLEVEIPEGALMADVKVSGCMLAQLHDLGVKVSVDDFGTGYCSYRYLSVFPLDTLKIDRSFVAAMSKSKRDLALVQSMIALANALNLRVVAEGAETREDLRMLVDAGCHQVQGYAVARPMPFSSFDEFRRQPLRCEGLSPIDVTQ